MNMDLLKKLVARENLSSGEAESLMEGMMSGSLTHAQMAAALVALKMKGETREEISAFAKVMRKNAVQINPEPESESGMLVDTCGTGGDSLDTFNISTAAAFIAAGAGVQVAKHGNRSVSGRSGSADALEQLGAKMLQPPQVERCIEQVGIGFMFAPFFHPAMKNAAPVRKELGIRTVFNILGPLTNPANAQAQVIGVFDPSLTGTFAHVLHSLGTMHALVVHSEGMDEIGLGKTRISELKDGKIENYEIDGKEFGFEKKEIPRVHGKEESAAMIVRVLEGERGAARDVSVLNAAAAIYVGGKAETIAGGAGLAADSIDSGKALEKLNRLVKFTGE